MVSKFLFSAQMVLTLSQVDVLFLVFWFSEFSFSFLNLLNFRIWESFRHFFVTRVTRLFRDFSHDSDFSALSQSNCRNFSGSSITTKTTNYLSFHFPVFVVFSFLLQLVCGASSAQFRSSFFNTVFTNLSVITKSEKLFMAVKKKEN